MTKDTYRYALKRIVRDVPLAQKPLLLGELVIKRTLAQILWLSWQSGLNPFGLVRGKGLTSGRYYIRNFLSMYADECKGAFLEFGEPFFRDMFNPQHITSYDIIDILPNDSVTIAADIQQCPQIASNTFDVIVCTQVLEHVANPFLAVAELHRILKPGGKLLITVPASYPYHADPQDYWRYSVDSLHLLLDPLFTDVRLHSYGNQLIVVAAYWFWMADHLPKKALDTVNPKCPTILCAYAVK